MPIQLQCSSCSQRLKAPDKLAGRTVPCPKCGAQLLIAAAEAEAPTIALKDDSPPPLPARPQQTAEALDAEPEEASALPERPVKRKAMSSLPPLTTVQLPFWFRHLHWLLVLALVPLAFSLVQSSAADTLESKLKATLDKAGPQAQQRVVGVLKELEQGHGSVEDLFAALPEQRFAGAFLGRGTWLHWVFALMAAALFMTFFLLLATHQTAHPGKLLGLGAFTATVGIVFLLALQVAANWSQGVWLTGRGIIIVVFYIVKFIGFSYQAALDPGNGFLLSFLGYTFGVGFCEEVVKAAPLLVAYRNRRRDSWRTAFLWGLASGAGFGIAEGIMYSSNYYNGISGPGIYVVRFISCVALHALWTGSVAITLNQRQALIQAPSAWYEFIPPLFVIVGIPMVLHGLYDTLLKKQLNAAALAVAVLSFLFLAFQISRLHTSDDQEADAKMLREYKRRRKAMA